MSKIRDTVWRLIHFINDLDDEETNELNTKLEDIIGTHNDDIDDEKKSLQNTLWTIMTNIKELEYDEVKDLDEKLKDTDFKYGIVEKVKDY